MPIQIDGIDAKILNIIQKDAAISVADIADEVGLSSSPCWRRIKRMEELGIIKNRVTILDRTKLGLDFEVFVAVKLALPNRANMEKLERAVANMPEVVQCASVTGAVDFMLRVVTKDMHCYEDFLREVLLVNRPNLRCSIPNSAKTNQRKQLHTLKLDKQCSTKGFMI